ncbi:MAG: SIR2 family protein [Prochloraceae cyanobacterium]|nr:SIR2 family protein [Prochloraceae cyanobacterium]
MITEEPLKHWARILIITAITPERDAVIKAFGIDFDRDLFSYRDGLKHYWRKELNLEGGDFYEIIVSCLYQAGNVNAGIETCQLINYLKPEALLMVGIAGGAGESKPGDLVIGKKISYYGRGKYTDKGLQLEPKSWEADKYLVEQVNLTLAPDWDSLLKDATKPKNAVSNPEIYVESIASGEAVIADQEKRNEISEIDRKIRAIAMEDAGIYEAANSSIEEVKCLSIRGISDRADETKQSEWDKEWQPYAAELASRYAKYFLHKRRPIKCNRTLDLLHQPVSQVEDYYKKKLKNHHTKVIEGITEEGKVVLFIGPGVNLYGEQAKDQPSEIDLAKHLIKEYSDSSGWMNFLGFPCLMCHAELKKRPRECPIWDICGESFEALEKSSCPLFLAQELAVAKNQIRYLSQFGKTYQGFDDFQVTLNQIFQKSNLTNLNPNPVHFLVKRLSKCRKKSSLPFLIVTTNYDNALERAFRKEPEQKFYLVTYVALGDKRGQFMYKLSDENEMHKIDDKTQLFTEYPVIMKLFGGFSEGEEEEEHGLAIADEDYMNYLFSTGEQKQSLSLLWPSSIHQALDENDFLFMGYSPSDWDLSLILHRFCACRRNLKDKKKKGTPAGWLIHQSMLGKLFDIEFWKGWNIELIKSPLEAYISGLDSALSESIG